MSKVKFILINELALILFLLVAVFPSFIDKSWLFMSLVTTTYVVVENLLVYIMYNKSQNLLNFVKRFEHLLKSKKFYLTLSVLLFLFFFSLAAKRHVNMYTNMLDFGLEQQVVWNTAHGRLFGASVEVNNYLGDHASFLIVLAAAIYWFIPSAFTLIAIQVVCVIIAAFFIYKLAKLKLKNTYLAFAVYLIYVFFVGVSGLMLSDYRPVVLALPFLASGLYYLEQNSHAKKGWILFIIAALAKEDMAIFVGTMGLYRFIFHKEKKGLVLAAYGFALGLIGLFVIIPYFRGVPSDTLARYNVIKIFSIGKAMYLSKLFLPMLFVSLSSWKKVWVMIPNLMMNLLSSHTGQINLLNQYDIATGLVMFWAALDGLSRLQANKLLFKQVFVIIIAMNVVILTRHMMWSNIAKPYQRLDDYIYLQALNETIPVDAVVATSGTVGGQLAERQNLQLFSPAFVADEHPPYTRDPDYIIVDKKVDLDASTQAEIANKLGQGYFVLEDTESFIVLKR
jgi:uncharacterized membrane protein